MALLVDIEKQVGTFHLKTAFTMKEEIAGLLGASGSGKSMTLRCIAGIEKPDRGRIVLNGRVLFDSEDGISLPPQQRHVGCLFQNYALFPNMTVLENILCGLFREKDRNKKRDEAERMMALLQLESVRDQYPHQLSGGQAQRAALGRILVNRPEFLMLDEPFSALDAHLRLRLQMDLRSLLADYGKGVLMVTHDRDEAYCLCERIGVMSHGQLLVMKETHELFADPLIREAAVLTGCKNIAAARKTGEREVFVPDWNIHLCTSRPVKDHLSAIGIRAHAFHPDTAENRFPVTFVGRMEEPFEWVDEFRFEQQRKETLPVWRRSAKGSTPRTLPSSLGVSPQDILLLYDFDITKETETEG